MLIRNRAETDTKHPAGSVGYTHGPARPSTASRSVLKLGDYVDQVKASEERTERLNRKIEFNLTFDEWWKTASFPWMDSVPKHWFEAIWKAAYQEGLKEGILSNQSEGYEEP